MPASLTYGFMHHWPDSLSCFRHSVFIICTFVLAHSLSAVLLSFWASLGRLNEFLLLFMRCERGSCRFVTFISSSSAPLFCRSVRLMRCRFLPVVFFFAPYSYDFLFYTCCSIDFALVAVIGGSDTPRCVIRGTIPILIRPRNCHSFDFAVLWPG